MALLISKKILPTALTLILACVVGLFGTEIISLPSLGVLATIVIGKVNPPSVDRSMATFAQFTGAKVVLPTLHETVCAEPEFQDIPVVLGAVTKKDLMYWLSSTPCYHFVLNLRLIYYLLLLT
ncbi:MAG: hypothetical protein IPK31_20705 [Chitinophagaceae bacterium]|nr:hypothetical protein [Chitinophagaceae bacterium]